jgi:serine/threonine protein kinase
MKVGDIVNSKYKIEEKISENDCFETFMVSLTVDMKMECLCKMVSVSPVYMEMKKEVLLLNDISMLCPYILGFKDIFEEKKKFCLVSHSCLGIPNLRMEIDEKRKNRIPFSQDDILLLLYQLSTALNFLHEKDLVHGCVSPDNILLMNGVFCLVDYGISKFIDRTKNSTWNIVFGKIFILSLVCG